MTQWTSSHPGLFKPNLVIRLNIVMASVALRNSDDVVIDRHPTTSRIFILFIILYVERGRK